MMGVVLMLAGAESGGNINWFIIVLGNLFVCAMEGLIVGIQVLRLEYYEMFSRFYKGSGREFRPFFSKYNRKKTISKLGGFYYDTYDSDYTCSSINFKYSCSFWRIFPGRKK